MKTLHKVIFYAFSLLCLVDGALLLLAPGRFLDFIGWAPVDPIISRMFGAALLGMAWGALRAVRAWEAKASSILVEVFFAFTALSTVGLLRHLLVANYPFMVWFLCAVIVIFSLLWAVVWFQLRKV